MEEQDLETRLKEDFLVFLWAIWVELRLPQPTRMQYDIALYLAGGPRRRMIQAFRGVGKSWITAAYVLWRLYRDPNERILVVSASKDRADAFSTFVKRLINEVEWLQYMKADPSKNQRDSLVAFDIGPSDPHQAPSVRSVGITGQLTGGRASIIIADDVEVPKNSLTVTMREKLSEAVKEFDAVLVPNGEVVYLGTPQTVMSLYNQLPSRGYDVRIWPARYPDAKQAKKYGTALAPTIIEDLRKDPSLGTKGSPTDPDRFDHQDLLEREASYGRSGFALQFMLDTSLSDATKFPLKMGDLLVMDLSPTMAPVRLAWGSAPDQLYAGPESPGGLPCVGLPGDRIYRPMFVDKDFAPYQGVVMSIDPSGRGGDETGYAVVAMLHGMLFTLALGGYPGGYEEGSLKGLAETAKRFGVKAIVIESNFGDGMFAKLFAPWLAKVGYPCTIIEERATKQKELRIIETIEPLLNQHRIVMDASVIRKDIETDPVEYQAFYQMTRITKEKGCLTRYDRLDAWEMALKYWVSMLDLDNEQAVERYRDDQVEKGLRDFMDSVLGTKPSVPNWNHSILG